MDWYVRDSRDSTLVPLLSNRQAELVARERSKINTTGIIELVVVESDGRMFVVAIFLRGRKVQQGQRARESSRLGLPPTA